MAIEVSTNLPVFDITSVPETPSHPNCFPILPSPRLSLSCTLPPSKSAVSLTSAAAREEVDTVELGKEMEVKVTPAQNPSVEQPFSKESARGARSMTLSADPPAEAVLDENGDAQPSPIPDELKDNDFGTLKIGNDGNMTLEAYDGPAAPAAPAEQPAGLAPPPGSTSPSEDPPTPQSDLTPQSSPSLQRPRGMSIDR